MYKPQRIYYPTGIMERLKYAIAVWNTFTERQQDNIYNIIGDDYSYGMLSAGYDYADKR